ncbi:MAG: nucleotidyltransferase family protein [Cyanothece sp. SIO2G6]|nr:nucleotidyltransferase family protein [Cyanothece sp. SIO2G6]
MSISTSPDHFQEQLPIPVPHDEIRQFCLQNHIRKFSWFGSVLRDDFTAASDIDVLVEFEPGKTPGFAIVTMQNQLSQLLNGWTVDLRTPQELSPYIRDRVLSEAVVEY